jgi:hypothetical protein
MDPVKRRRTYDFARLFVKVVWKVTVDETSTISSIPTDADTSTPVEMEDSSGKEKRIHVVNVNYQKRHSLVTVILLLYSVPILSLTLTLPLVSDPETWISLV